MNKWEKFLRGMIDVEGQPVCGLIDIVKDKYKDDLPEIDLLATIVVQAAEDHDLVYFDGWAYRWHCYLLRLNHEEIMQYIRRLWDDEE